MGGGGGGDSINLARLGFVCVFVWVGSVAVSMAGSFVAVRGKPRSSPKRSGGGGADPPLSLAMPTVADLHKTAELEKVIYLSTVSN